MKLHKRHLTCELSESQQFDVVESKAILNQFKTFSINKNACRVIRYSRVQTFSIFCSFVVYFYEWSWYCNSVFSSPSAAQASSSSCLFDTFVSVDGLRKRSGAITNWLRVNVNCMMMARLILRRSTKLSFSALPLKAQFPCSTGKQRKVCYDARIL